MAEFNAMDTAAFKGVWVFCEQREGQIQTISYQLLSEGRKLANDLGVELCGVVMGSELNEDYVKALGGYGADRVYNIDSPLLKDYTTDGYAKALCDLIMDKKPEIMLIGATNLGRDLGPRCAARLHTGLTADCTHLDVDVEKYKNFLRTTSNIDVDNTKFEENTNLKMTRPAFGGHLMATIICPRFRPQMSTVRPGVMQTQPFDEAGAAKVVVEKVTPALTAEDIHVQVLDIKKSAEKLVDLIGADVVVAVGRGISADPDKGIKFSYYASFWIKAYILKFIMDNWRMVKIGTTQVQRKLFYNLNRERQKLVAQGFDPDAAMLSERLGVSEEQITEMDQRLAANDLSLNAQVGEEAGGATRMDFLPALGPGIEDSLGDSEVAELLREKLKTILPKLNEKELYILQNRLLTDDPVTLREIGERYNVTRERVRQLEARLLEKIRQHLALDIKDFSDAWIQ